MEKKNPKLIFVNKFKLWIFLHKQTINGWLTKAYTNKSMTKLSSVEKHSIIDVFKENKNFHIPEYNMR